MRALLLFVLLGACNKPEPPTATATKETVPTKSAPTAEPSTPSSAPPSAFPALEDACSSDADCTVTGMLNTCCGGCEMKFSNKTYVAKVTAYCAAHPPQQCPPLGCSWAMSTPACVAGKCQAKK